MKAFFAGVIICLLSFLVATLLNIIFNISVFKGYVIVVLFFVLLCILDACRVDK